MKQKFYIGCSGYSESLWRGEFYPESLPSKEFLEFYSQNLNSVEINSTFYRRPTQKTLKNWHSQTTDDFKFFIKIPKTITHFKRLNGTADDISDFCNHIETGLEEKLKGYLFQFPSTFKFNEENLEKILKISDKNRLFVIEFRDASWWTADVFKNLEKEKLIFSGVSIPRKISDEVVINSKTILYYRLHGVHQMFKSSYSEEFLDDLASEIRKFKGQSFVFFNNTFGTAGIKNALYLHQILNKNP